MNSNGISTNETRSPMQGANPETAKMYININTHIRKIQIYKPLPPISMHHEHNHLNASRICQKEEEYLILNVRSL
jgi:hypothetical protein